MIERRALLKWLAGLTAGMIVSAQTNAQDKTQPSGSSTAQGDRLGEIVT